MTQPHRVDLDQVPGHGGRHHRGQRRVPLGLRICVHLSEHRLGSAYVYYVTQGEQVIAYAVTVFVKGLPKGRPGPIVGNSLWGALNWSGRADLAWRIDHAVLGEVEW